MIPLYGFLQGDTIGLLILARPEDTALDLGRKLEQAARVRVRPSGRWRVVYRGQTLEPSSTLAEAGMQPLDRFDVVKEGS